MKSHLHHLGVLLGVETGRHDKPAGEMGDERAGGEHADFADFS